MAAAFDASLHTFADQLALERGDGRKDVEQQPCCRLDSWMYCSFFRPVIPSPWFFLEVGNKKASVYESKFPEGHVAT